MIFDAMNTCNADGVSLCEAHPDLEVFRLRLGKALNYEFNEDTQTGLFQRRDPREGGPTLDIERGALSAVFCRICSPLNFFYISYEQIGKGCTSIINCPKKATRVDHQ